MSEKVELAEKVHFQGCELRTNYIRDSMRSTHVEMQEDEIIIEKIGVFDTCLYCLLYT